MDLEWVQSPVTGVLRRAEGGLGHGRTGEKAREGEAEAGAMGTSQGSWEGKARILLWSLRGGAVWPAP